MEGDVEPFCEINHPKTIIILLKINKQNADCISYYSYTEKETDDKYERKKKNWRTKPSKLSNKFQ